MPAFNAFNTLRPDLARGVHNFDAHSFKLALSNVAPVATNNVLADITQIANGGGYVAGGYALDNVAVVATGANARINIDEEAVTATGGAIAAFRYLVIYNDTSAGDRLIGWIDQGESRSFLQDEQFRLRFNDALGAISIA